MKRIVCILGIFVSLIIIVTGLVTYASADEFFVKSGISFGADFYTEIFEEVEQIKASARSIDNAIYEVGGLLLSSIGGISFCAFCFMFFDTFKKKNIADNTIKENSTSVENPISE